MVRDLSCLALPSRQNGRLTVIVVQLLGLRLAMRRSQQMGITVIGSRLAVLSRPSVGLQDAGG